jgi:hypothetical protein
MSVCPSTVQPRIFLRRYPQPSYHLSTHPTTSSRLDRLNSSEFQQSLKVLGEAMKRRGRETHRKTSCDSYRPQYEHSPASNIKSEALSTTYASQHTAAIPYSMFDQAEAARRNTVCGNCKRRGHEVIECVRADAHGMVNACPVHNTAEHNLWSCPLRPTLSGGMIFEYLFVQRRGIPQLAWGQDISIRYRGALTSRCHTHPWPTTIHKILRPRPGQEKPEILGELYISFEWIKQNQMARLCLEPSL